MPRIPLTCPRCGWTGDKYWQPSHPQPIYCSRRCMAQGLKNGHRLTLSNIARQKYHFTEALDEAITRAYRGKLGSLKRL